MIECDEYCDKNEINIMLDSIIKSKEYLRVESSSENDRKRWQSLLTPKKDNLKGTLVINNQRVRVSWVLEVFYTDGMQGIREYVMELLPELNEEDVINAALLALVMRDKRINF